MFRTFAIAALLATASTVTLKQKMAAQQGPPSWKDILEVLDQDGNGQISWKEIEGFIAQVEEEHGVTIPAEDKAEIKKVFDMVDSDGSGEIDEAEFEAALTDAGALGQKSKKSFGKLVQMKSKLPPSWEDILDVLDQDGNGQISWKEIEGFIAQVEEEHGVTIPAEDKAEIKKVFDMVDSDGSGEIDEAEFEAALTDAGALGQKSKKSFGKLVQMKNKQKMAAKQGPPSWEDVLAVLDTDASGTVSWAEVTDFIKKIEKEHNVKISKKDKEAIKAGFDAVDTDGSGDVNKAEFEAAVAAEEGLGQLKKYL